ncbi:aquaporin AQPAn.G [Aedes albopictus]|uniref:Aquaporin major intrinsic protein family n=1 Tax=Aedes albopictus TaxID=7160 RepID=A0ABM1YSH2_AEDAL|nr:aquaporin AQPAn.G isoform X1 [Aedes albopictus]XP_029730844.1 aquaporin AQPAn.G-like isoform X1 [Aedes albopictus]
MSTNHQNGKDAHLSMPEQHSRGGGDDDGGKKGQSFLGTGHNARDVVSIFLAEFSGTATLMFLGCMCCVTGFGNTPTNVSGGIGFGFTVMMAIITFGHVSGAHINPSVSIAALVYGLLNIPMFILYLIAQFLGGLCGYGLLMAVTPMKLFTEALETGNGACVTAPHDDLSTWEAFGVEFFITGILVWTCCGLWDPRNSKFGEGSPVKFALIVAGISIAAGPYTGASMNPARTLPPSVWNASYKSTWIYFIAPPLAGMVMPLIYKYVFRREAPQDKHTAMITRTTEQIKASIVEQHRF